MPFTHHSHSSTYCAHASSPLDAMISRYHALKFHTLCLTEHCPRDHSSDLYPEELSANLTPFDLFSTFSTYVTRARALQATHDKDPNGMRILVGCEMEYIRPESLDLIKELCAQHELDFVVGSVHHVCGVPIDFDRAMWEKARALCGGETGLFERYFDHQFEVLKAVKPAVVGHFDLVRLFCDDWRKPLREYGEGVWERVRRNVEFVVGYGGLVELNSSAVRKGWDTPYPRRDVCELVLEKGGRFCLSDDAHAVAQVGLNFHVVLEYIESLGVKDVYYLEKLPMGQIAVDVLGGLRVHKQSVEELKQEPFWAILAEEQKAVNGSG